MKLVYKGKFDETTSSGLVQDSAWEPVEDKPAKRAKKTKTEDSQDETGAE